MSEMKIYDKDAPKEVECVSTTVIKVNGIEYAPKYTSDGLDIPCILVDTSDDNKYKPYYIRVPKSVLKDMLIDLLRDSSIEAKIRYMTMGM